MDDRPDELCKPRQPAVTDAIVFSSRDVSPASTLHAGLGRSGDRRNFGRLGGPRPLLAPLFRLCRPEKKLPHLHNKLMPSHCIDSCVLYASIIPIEINDEMIGGFFS
jgi:hypothetical protein